MTDWFVLHNTPIPIKKSLLLLNPFRKSPHRINGKQNHHHKREESGMKKNMGSMDKAVRILAAVTILILYLAEQISGTAVLILGAISIVFVATSLMGYCPLYSLFKVKTINVQEKAEQS